MNRLSSLSGFIIGFLVSGVCSAYGNAELPKESALSSFTSSMRDGIRTIGNDVSSLRDTAKSKASDVWAETKNNIAHHYTTGTNYVKTKWHENPSKTAIIGTAIVAGVIFVAWGIWNLFQSEEPVYQQHRV